VLFSFIDIILGSVIIPFKDILKSIFSSQEIESAYNTIIFDFKLPKLYTAIIAGASLSVAGLLMQTVFRNPLAGPYVLGISSGASLGVAILLLGFAGILPETYNLTGSWATAIAAWIGAGLVLILIFLISLRVSNVITVLIIGVLIGSAISSLVNLLQYIGSAEKLKTFILWTMGSLGGVTKEHFYIIIPAISAGFILAIFSIKQLDSLILGENYAKTMGVNLLITRISVFTATTLLAGTVTAFCGPIGFVGIIVPHLARLIFDTASHKILIPASAIIGAIMLVVSDIISQLPGLTGTVPINSVTAILGIPIVIKIILDKKGF
jgi:iron complex transport system permease protein